MIEGLLFYLFALTLVVSSVCVVTARRPVHAVLFLILAFFNAAGVFLTLGAEFLAFILLIVYVGAVAVLFLFVVMMLDSRDLSQTPSRRIDPVGIGIGGVLLAQLGAVVALWSGSNEPVVGPTVSVANNTQSLGLVLYTDFAFPFQVSGVILLVAILGAIVLTMSPRRSIKRQNVAEQLGINKKDVVELCKVQTGGGVL